MAAKRFLGEEEQLITLTHDQALLLKRFGRERRMVVTGPAGSGKTMLAVERAKALAAEGKRVLFVCFNKGLSQHLSRRERDSGVRFSTFHGLCVSLAKRAGVKLSVDDPAVKPAPAYWSDELPLALMAAAEELGPQFDALFVDEAQDLHNDWLDALMASVAEPENALVWLFMDDNQRVYANDFVVPREFRPFDLIHNCRNTQAIHREVMKKYKGEVRPEALGPEGRELEMFGTDDPAKVVRQVIERLCRKEEVLPQDIVVLSSHAIEKSVVGRSDGGRYVYVREPKPVGNEIRFSSIRAFKGMESPVVVLCELEDVGAETID